MFRGQSRDAIGIGHNEKKCVLFKVCCGEDAPMCSEKSEEKEGKGFAYERERRDRRGIEQRWKGGAYKFQTRKRGLS